MWTGDSTPMRPGSKSSSSSRKTGSTSTPSASAISCARSNRKPWNSNWVAFTRVNGGNAWLGIPTFKTPSSWICPIKVSAASKFGTRSTSSGGDTQAPRRSATSATRQRLRMSRRLGDVGFGRDLVLEAGDGLDLGPGALPLPDLEAPRQPGQQQVHRDEHRAHDEEDL